MKDKKLQDSEIENNEDFVILDGGDVHKERDREDDQKRKEHVYIIFKDAADYANLAIMQRLWTALSTLHLFFTPALLGLILGHVYLLIGMDDDISVENDMKPVMLALFGVSVFIGLPLHIFALGDLGEALYEAEEIFMRTNSGTQTEDDHVIRICIEQRY